MKRTPAFWIGVAVSVVLAVLTTLTGQGVISDALAGRITDVVTALGQFLVLISPIITGILIHPVVTPTADPQLPVGTTVNDGAAVVVRAR